MTQQRTERAMEAFEVDRAELARRLEEAEETIHAIQMGAVDAFVMNELTEPKVYTLEGADRPYRNFVEQMADGAATLLDDGTIAYCNRRLAELLRMKPEALIGMRFSDLVAPEDRVIFDNLMWQGRTRTGRGEATLRRADGAESPVFLTFSALPGGCGASIAVLVNDLTVQKHHEALTAAHQALRESQSQLARQKEALEVALSAAPLESILAVMARSAQELAGPGARTGIFLLDQDGRSLRFGAAAGMDQSYIDLIEGHRVGPDSPGCGTAAFTGKPEIVPDVERDEKWKSIMTVARTYDIRACWSCPIIGSTGKPLGTIAIYHRTVREPAPGELEPIFTLTRTAAVIIERHSGLQPARGRQGAGA